MDRPHQGADSKTGVPPNVRKRKVTQTRKGLRPGVDHKALLKKKKESNSSCRLLEAEQKCFLYDF